MSIRACACDRCADSLSLSVFVLLTLRGHFGDDVEVGLPRVREARFTRDLRRGQREHVREEMRGRGSCGSGCSGHGHRAEGGSSRQRARRRGGSRLHGGRGSEGGEGGEGQRVREALSLLERICRAQQSRMSSLCSAALAALLCNRGSATLHSGRGQRQPERIASARRERGVQVREEHRRGKAAMDLCERKKLRPLHSRSSRGAAAALKDAIASVRLARGGRRIVQRLILLLPHSSASLFLRPKRPSETRGTVPLSCLCWSDRASDVRACRHCVSSSFDAHSCFSLLLLHRPFALLAHASTQARLSAVMVSASARAEVDARGWSTVNAHSAAVLQRMNSRLLAFLSARPPVSPPFVPPRVARATVMQTSTRACSPVAKPLLAPLSPAQPPRALQSSARSCCPKSPRIHRQATRRRVW